MSHGPVTHLWLPVQMVKHVPKASHSPLATCTDGEACPRGQRVCALEGGVNTCTVSLLLQDLPVAIPPDAAKE